MKSKLPFDPGSRFRTLNRGRKSVIKKELKELHEIHSKCDLQATKAQSEIRNLNTELAAANRAIKATEDKYRASDAALKTSETSAKLLEVSRSSAILSSLRGPDLCRRT